MIPAAGIALVTPADSARAVSSVYTASLLATLPVVLAAIAAIIPRRSTAQSRMLVWRSAVVTLLAVCTSAVCCRYTGSLGDYLRRSRHRSSLLGACK
jgi:hypothetical protein